MESVLELTPHGHVICRDPRDDWAAFAESDSAGLIALGGHKLPETADTSAAFWKEFANEFIRILCHIPEDGPLEIPLPNAAMWNELMLNAPPMRGAEYLSPDVLRAIWNRMEEWTRKRVVQGEGLPAFLESHAPLWSRVGRVTLHLAENKGDPEFPFAFMATYASGLAKSGRLRQLPLGKALQEYAGADNKPALLKLLSPLYTAAKHDPLMADLLETGDVFHPLVWLPAEAYDFLKAIPAYEEAGLSASLPNWWKKKNPRPQVAVTIGEQKGAGLGINTLLKCRLNVVIDGRRLSSAEVDELLAGPDGLILLRGQWVEVDREKLRQALEHWKAVERHGEISFAEGMRLLAGAPANLKQVDNHEELRKWAFTQPGKWMSETLDQLRNPEQSAPPETLNATLRPYQQTGLNWLWFCARTGLGACLADDMGLGKTIQVLAALLRKQTDLPDSKPSLLVVPASLIGNWKREAAKFAPTLHLSIAHRSETENLAEPAPHTDLVITTYG
ncbi:MAG: hypothetical protein JW713_08105, partial [Pontiellaceae bacterium]|nr:hypothetical protein [Pontiellaceae bacterium]